MPTPDRPAAPGSVARPEHRPDDRPVLPDVSRDETDEGWGDRPDQSDDDRIRAEVPPHHVG